MADKTVSVSLVGKDSLSPVFAKVGASATAAGKTIDAAGRSVETFDREATTASQSMSRFEQATARAEAAAGRLGISASRVGAAIGTGLTVGLTLAVKAAADAEVSQQRLQTTIEATGALFEQYSSQIDAVNSKALSLSFDDEDAQDALTGLIQATNDVDLSLSQMGLAMDVARGRGIDLAAAAKIVAAADQERFGALKRLGIQIDENSTKESVLADLQQRYAGQAQAYADTNAGAFDRWGNSVENALESVGAFLGPAQQLLLIFPGITAGVTGMSAGLSALGGSTAIAGSGIAALAGTAGIAGLGIAATIAVTGGVGMLIGKLAVDTPKAAGDAAASIQDLIDKALQLDDIGELGSHLIELKDATEYNDTIIEITGHLNELMAVGNDLAAMSSDPAKQILPVDDAAFAAFSHNAQLVIDSNDDMMISFEEVSAAYDAMAGDNMAMAESAASVNSAIAASADEFDTLMQLAQGVGPAADYARDGLNNLTAALLNGTLAPSQYETALQGVIDHVHDMQEATLSGADAIASFSGALGDAGITAKHAAGDLSLFFDDVAHNITEVDKGREAWEKWQKTVASNQYVMQLQHDSSVAVGIALGHVTEAVAKAQAALGNLKFTPPKSMGAEFKVDFDFGESLDKFDIEGARDRIVKAFSDIATAPEALSNGYRVIVSNTEAIGQNAQQVQDWADELIGAGGAVAKMDDLLARQVISQEQYNAAQAAYGPIAEANAHIQDNILKIQTEQAPVLAGLMQTTDAYIDRIADMTGAQQTAALGFMDSSESAEALQLKMLALDATSGALGQDGAKWATGIIEGAAAADPVLASMLEQMGLISIGADGTITVNLDDQASGPLQTLNDTVEKLAYTELLLHFDGDTTKADAAFEDVFGHAAEWNDSTSTGTLDADNSDALGKLDEAQGRLAQWGSSSGTASVNAVDNATNVINSVWGALRAIDGGSATVFVNSVSTSRDALLGLSSGGTIPQMANGGTSAYGYSKAAKNGMTATLVGEVGPEVVMLPGGAQVMNAAGSRSRMAASGGGAPSFQFVNNGTIIGIDDLEAQMMRAMSEAWVRANQMHERSVR